MMSETLQNLERHGTAVTYCVTLSKMIEEREPHLRDSNAGLGEHGAEFLTSFLLQKLDESHWERIADARMKYAEAKAAGQAEVCEYIARSIHEVFLPPAAKRRAFSAKAVLADSQHDPVQVEATRKARQLREDFMQRYWAAKANCDALTIDRIAERSGLHRSTIIAIEKGNTLPRFETIVCLARAFGVPPSQLMWR